MTVPTGRIRVGPDCGRLLLRTKRDGFAARAGHDLTIEVTRWEAEIDSSGDGPTAAVIAARIDLESLEIREGTGGALPLTDSDRRQIRETARRILTTGGAASATFESSSVITAGQAGGAIEGTVSLHGTARPVRLEVSQLGPSEYRATASLRQSEFGIKPYTAFLGALKLRDAVEVEVDVDLANCEVLAGNAG